MIIDIDPERVSATTAHFKALGYAVSDNAVETALERCEARDADEVKRVYQAFDNVEAGRRLGLWDRTEMMYAIHYLGISQKRPGGTRAASDPRGERAKARKQAADQAWLAAQDPEYQAAVREGRPVDKSKLTTGGISLR